MPKKAIEIMENDLFNVPPLVDSESKKLIDEIFGPISLKTYLQKKNKK
jgi:hypothetical protein